MMDKTVRQQIITELQQKKEEWLKEANNCYSSWATEYKALSQGAASGISDAINIIKKHMERNNINGK